MAESLFLRNSRLRLFFVSFSLLFFELLCIRWIPAHVRYLGYFTNFILMASFLGLGLGILAARRKNFWFPPFPVLLLFLVLVVMLSRFELEINSTYKIVLHHDIHGGYALAVVGVVSLLAILGFGGKATLGRFDWHMFFLGAAFSLLEVKALTTFALLFGSTWMVNSMVFFAILSSVLLAVLFNARFKLRRIGIVYVLLFGMLLLNLLLRPETLLFENPALRYIVASFLVFAPVFLANVIFSNSFRDTEAADIAFASNLLGIMLGAMQEYSSMLFGYHLLLVPIIGFYLLARLLRSRSKLIQLRAA